MNATGISLPTLIDTELRGVPPHVWELETAEHLLGDWCWIEELHQNTISRRDYSSFRLKAWCTQPKLVPSSMELAVVEPPVRVQEEMSSKRALGYKIGISVHSVPPPPPRAPRPLPPRDDSDQGSSRHRRRLQGSPESNLNSGASGSTSRPPVHARLGMPTSGTCAERGPVVPALIATGFTPIAQENEAVLLTASSPSGQSTRIEAGNTPTAQENEAVQLPTTPSPSGQRARIEDLAAEVIKPTSGRLSQIMGMPGDIPGVVSPVVPHHGHRSTVISAQMSLLQGCCPPAMHGIISQADELPIDDPVLLPMSPRTGHEDNDGSHAVQLADQDSLANSSELATTPLEATRRAWQSRLCSRPHHETSTAPV
jgi:hypothetical protein